MTPARTEPREPDLQHAWACALRDPDLPASERLSAWNGSDVGRRFNVHRNTFVSSLAQALGETLPVCRQALGAEVFDSLAVAFVRAHPPRSPVLAEWGDDFGPWLMADPCAGKAWPWLPELAALERARVTAYHADDASPMALASLQDHFAQGSALMGARLRLHPSFQLIRTQWSVVSLWAAHQGAIEPQGLAVHESPEAALVLRDDTREGDVLILPLTHPAAAFCASLLAGRALADALAAAQHEAVPDGAVFDLVTTLALLIRHGAIVAWLAPGDTQ